jgi:hypothetical protein
MLLSIGRGNAVYARYRTRKSIMNAVNGEVTALCIHAKPRISGCIEEA